MELIFRSQCQKDRGSNLVKWWIVLPQNRSSLLSRFWLRFDYVCLHWFASFCRIREKCVNVGVGERNASLRKTVQKVAILNLKVGKMWVFVYFLYATAGLCRIAKSAWLSRTNPILTADLPTIYQCFLRAGLVEISEHLAMADCCGQV